ncbi:MAG TPA: 6-bladed beta-propeller [Coriobacteriia bacterium]|nr:6-bladed beta-propeller [Coriobacteriia bacterium]
MNEGTASSDDAVRDNLALQPRHSLTRRERRRRIILLVLLLLLLGIALFLTFWWSSNRSLPIPAIGREGEALAPPRYLYSITGTGANALTKPIGVDVAANGNVYVVDFGKRRVSVFTARGRFLRAFNKTAKGALRNPVHLQIIHNEVWVTDRRLRGIFIFGMDGTFKRRFEPVNEPDFNWTPLALAFDKAGALRATDVGQTDKHRLIYFSEDGSRTAMIGKTRQVTQIQEGRGEFFFPNGLAVAPNGYVYVADGDNRRVQVLDAKAKFKKVIDTSGVPRGLEIDDKKRLYVVDALAHQIDIFDLSGKRLVSFGERGFGPGQFNYPNDIATDTKGRIFITDRENNQVQVWSWPAFVVPSRYVPQAGWQWGTCAIPLLFLPLLLLLRRRRYIVTPVFVTGLVEAGRADLLKKRVRYVAPESDRAHYEDVEVDGLKLVDVISFDEYSPSDVAALREKLRCGESEAIYLTMADRARALLTTDVELRRLGIISQIRVLDVDEFVNEVGGGAQ